MTRNTITFGPLFNHFVGLETLAAQMERFAEQQPVIEKYPPHNILKQEDNKYVVELATAGFKQNELSIEVKDNVLKIVGQQSEDSSNIQYLQKGISTKSFVKTIPLVDTIEVRGAEYVDGILRIGLENVIPEHRKPKTIPILGSLSQEQTLLTE